MCIYLVGGNDGNNLIVPLENRQYRAYASLRGGLALAADDLLPVQGGRNPGAYGFHPALAELRDLYNRGVLAVVANTGSGEPPDAGVGHSYKDLAFLPGQSFTLSFANASRAVTTARGVTIAALSRKSSGATYRDLLQSAGAARFSVPFPSTGLGASLKDVAALAQQTIAGGFGALITVPMGSFDTHAVQLQTQASLFCNLSASMTAFYAAAEEAGIANRVTVFTDSEFGRAIRPNTQKGTDHGWGNHQLVMGASVLGKDIYGVFPDMTVATQDSGGGWVPTTSRDEYLSTLLTWAGISDSDLQQRAKRLRTNLNLGFVA